MSSWASRYIAHLRAGHSVSFRPRGNSMAPKIKSGALCTVMPVAPDAIRAEAIRVGDVVLCTVRGRDYLHNVLAIGELGWQIGNNRGGVNGWTRDVHGVVAKIEK